MKKTKEVPSQEVLLNLFYYDNGLKWKMDSNRGCMRVKAGDDVVGTVNRKGYAQITIQGVPYLLSRIVYQFVYGNLTSDLVIDHINRKKLDNRIENLRTTTVTHNNRNRSKQLNNSTGVTGVALQTCAYSKSDGTTVEYKYYVAHWTGGSGKTKMKTFSVFKFGDEGAFELACAYRKTMIESLNARGAGYTLDHGS